MARRTYGKEGGIWPDRDEEERFEYIGRQFEGYLDGLQVKAIVTKRRSEGARVKVHHLVRVVQNR
jgi:hypothetical protein